MKILWCITGAGEFLKESIAAMGQLKGDDITVYLSRAGDEVLRHYDLFREVKRTWGVNLEDDFASMKAGRVSLKEYDAVVVSPASANTIAKIANGISDNLVTTAVSLALKTGTKVYVVPTDWIPANVKIPEVLTPGGSIIHMKPRKSDLRNIKYLEDEGIRVIENPNELLKALK